jgi:hypothetical protein
MRVKFANSRARSAAGSEARKGQGSGEECKELNYKEIIECNIEEMGKVGSTRVQGVQGQNGEEGNAHLQTVYCKV